MRNAIGRAKRMSEESELRNHRADCSPVDLIGDEKYDSTPMNEVEVCRHHFVHTPNTENPSRRLSVDAPKLRHVDPGSSGSFHRGHPAESTCQSAVSRASRPAFGGILKPACTRNPGRHTSSRPDHRGDARDRMKSESEKSGGIRRFLFL